MGRKVQYFCTSKIPVCHKIVINAIKNTPSQKDVQVTIMFLSVREDGQKSLLFSRYFKCVMLDGEVQERRTSQNHVFTSKGKWAEKSSIFQDT